MFLKNTFRLCKLYGKVSPCGYFPIFVRKSSQKINAVLLKLDSDIRNNEDVCVHSTVKDLESIDSNWPQMVDGQKILASVIHGLHENECHSDVNTLVNFLLSTDYEMWSGMSTTVLKSYIEQKLWKEALLWFENMKQGRQLKHLRVYNDIINALSQDGLLKLAYHYFNEVQEEELHLKTSRLKSVSHETLVQFLECALSMRKSHKIDISDSYMKTSDFETDNIVDGVNNYLQNWAEPIPNNLLELIGTLLKFKNIYDINVTSEKSYKCAHCDADLLTNPDFPNLCENVASFIRNRMIKAGLHKDLDYLDQILNKFEYFDFLVDAGNVMFHGSKNEKIYSPDRLEYLLMSLKKNAGYEASHIVLVFPQSFHKPNKLKPLNFIEDICKANIFNFQLSAVTLRRTHDDLVLFYLAAKSELFLHKRKRLTIVSNDNFLDHRFVAGKYQHEFFRWLHHRQKTVDLQGNINITQNIQPIVRSDDGSMHLISKDGIVWCVKER